MKKILLYGVVLLGCCTVGLTGAAVAADKGPAEMTLTSTVDPAPTPKPATFPHAAHQSRLECGACHHAKGADGKQIAYSEGQKIEKCESCHNSKAGMPDKINTFKNAAHTLCQGCHRSTKPELAKCTVCHK
ncbi:cytochrome c3 family protein [Desulfobulbus elongatus]|uniref:cytochrome c3 family protein n=1 Tax=Desulfobulbus elongatus TaxID=53332 RepID=UPI0004818799|nr:cytochrome c3 family protein [Desulfobulbus elongatus]